MECPRQGKAMATSNSPIQLDSTLGYDILGPSADIRLLNLKVPVVPDDARSLERLQES